MNWSSGDHAIPLAYRGSDDVHASVSAGAYQASAQFQAYSTSGNGDYESYTTPVYAVTC